MSLRWRTYLLTVAIFVAVAALGYSLVQRSIEVNSAINGVLSSYDPAAAQAAQLETALSDMQRGVTGFLLTGEESDLRPYVEGSRRSDLAIQQLRIDLAEDSQLTTVLDWVQNDRDRWIAEVARPTIDATRAGQFEAALSFYNDPRSDEYLSTLLADTATLRALIEDRRQQAFVDLTRLTYSLIQLLVIALSVALLLVLGTTYLASLWVVRPLDELRAQLRQVARKGEHKRTITASGPPELRAVGRDAEVMRRQLVSEIDEARSAREALDQRAPVVAAIRGELLPSGDVDLAELAVAGHLQPAEGVLAGDWWDATVLPSGEAAFIVTDISGHGAVAGIAAMQLKHAVMHDLIAGKDIGEIPPSAADVFKKHPDRFATAAAVAIHPSDGVVRWINAGHHDPLVVSPAGEVVQSLGITGPILSWLGGEWVTQETRISPGDTLLMFSDGLVESHDEHGDQLGDAQLAEWLAESQAMEPAELVPWLIGKARQRAVDWERDDVTVLAVTWNPVPSDEANGNGSSTIRSRVRRRMAATD